MTDADKPVFAASMARLCLALREKDPDAAQMRVYFEGMRELEIEFVTAAAEQIASYAEWFPKASEWREAAVKLEHTRVEAQRAMLRKLHVPLCAACSDTGWDRPDDDRVTPCDCRKLRRLELLGRRPMPALPPAPSVLVPIDVEKIAETLAGPKGIK